MTHREKRDQEHETNRKGVMQLLRMSLDEYNSLVFENAYKHYEDSEYDWSRDSIKDLTSTKIFWKWWKNQYCISDKKFLYTVENNIGLYSSSTNELRELYNSMHIRINAFVDGFILNEATKELRQLKKDQAKESLK